MSITIKVTAKCESMTQRGTKCTKEAKVYEPGLPSDTSLVRVTKEGGRYSSYNAIPTGFRCDTHSRFGLAAAQQRLMRNLRNRR